MRSGSVSFWSMANVTRSGTSVRTSILVDEYGRTSNPDIFAAGEVTRHPTPGCPVPQRIESWQVAEQQAACAGSSVAGVPTAYRQVPWLWSDQGDLNLQILGVVPRMAEWIIRGALDAPSFCAIAMADSAPRGSPRLVPLPPRPHAR